MNAFAIKQSFLLFITWLTRFFVFCWFIHQHFFQDSVKMQETSVCSLTAICLSPYANVSQHCGWEFQLKAPWKKRGWLISCGLEVVLYTPCLATILTLKEKNPLHVCSFIPQMCFFIIIIIFISSVAQLCCGPGSYIICPLILKFDSLAEIPRIVIESTVLWDF